MNTDQESQYISNEFVKAVTKDHKIRFSMDGKRRCIDNVFIERLGWAVKYEDVYIREYRNRRDLYFGMENSLRNTMGKEGIWELKIKDLLIDIFLQKSPKFLERSFGKKYLINLKSA